MLIVPIILQTLFVPITYLLGRRLGKYTGWVVSAELGFSLAYLLAVTVNSHEEFLEETYAWGGSLPLKFLLRADNISLLLAILINFLCLLASIYSIAYMERESGQETYYSLLTLFALGMTGVVLSANLIQFFFFWELMVLPSFFLIAKWGYGGAWDAALRYFIYSQFGAALILSGIALTYASTGTLNMYELPSLLENIEPGLWQFIVVSLILGFGIKMALWPVQAWLPPAHADAPTPISVLLSGIMIKCGVYGILRVHQLFFRHAIPIFSITLGFIAIVTMLYGGLMALIETDLKKLFAYSSISHMGYIFFGLSFALDHGPGLSAALLHIINHALSKGLLFMCAGVFLHSFGTRDIRNLRIGIKRPVTFVGCIIGALGLVGLPPTLGFWSKDMLLAAALETHILPFIIAMVATSALAVAYSLRWIFILFLGRNLGCDKDHGTHPEHKTPLTMEIPILILVVAASASIFYLGSLGSFLEIEHIEIEFIPLSMSIIGLLIGGLPIYLAHRKGILLKGVFQENSFGKAFLKVLEFASLEKIYYGIFARFLLTLSHGLFERIETGIIDRFNYAIAGLVRSISEQIRRIQTGILSFNFLVVLVAISIILLYILMTFF